MCFLFPNCLLDIPLSICSKCPSSKTRAPAVSTRVHVKLAYSRRHVFRRNSGFSLRMAVSSILYGASNTHERQLHHTRGPALAHILGFASFQRNSTFRPSGSFAELYLVPESIVSFEATLLQRLNDDVSPQAVSAHLSCSEALFLQNHRQIISSP